MSVIREDLKALTTVRARQFVREIFAAAYLMW